jgi:hypothetical protein
LRERDGMQQLLVVDNGLPVTCHHVLGMALPYLSSPDSQRNQPNTTFL